MTLLAQDCSHGWGKTKTEEIMFKNIREENSCSFKKFNRPQVAETQSDLYLDTLYIVKMLQAREKENLKSSKRKRAYYIQGIIHMINSWLLAQDKS